jgi:hypothetical protein
MMRILGRIGLDNTWEIFWLELIYRWVLLINQFDSTNPTESIVDQGDQSIG